MKRPVLLSIILSAAFILTSCSPEEEVSKGPEMKKSPVPVEVMKIEPLDLPVMVECVGRLTPYREVLLSTEVGGVIDSYEIDSGERVIKGQALIKIDPTDYRLALKEAEASLKMALAQLEASEKGFERSKNLLPRNVITPDAFEKLEAEFKSSCASMERVKVMVDIAEERLKKTEITAPFSGLIASRMVERGQTVGVGQPLITLIDLDPIRVRIYLSERDYVHLEKKNSVTVMIEAYPDRRFDGHIDRIGVKADERTNTFDVEILVDNPDIFLKAGMTARVYLTTGIFKGAIMIPQRAVLYRKDRQEVFIMDSNGRARVREVELGRNEKSLVQIIRGLNRGDTLIVTGNQYLRSGDMVILSRDDNANT